MSHGKAPPAPLVVGSIVTEASWSSPSATWACPTLQRRRVAEGCSAAQPHATPQQGSNLQHGGASSGGAATDQVGAVERPCQHAEDIPRVAAGSREE
mmetsp:Transcript_18837/g.42096  ORF Transcript_18837/g.42096 Transcript_18837/m.42096 type:complete len:97 (+) Transcript_18837:609-899(+)